MLRTPLCGAISVLQINFSNVRFCAKKCASWKYILQFFNIGTAANKNAVPVVISFSYFFPCLFLTFIWERFRKMLLFASTSMGITILTRHSSIAYVLCVSRGFLRNRPYCPGGDVFADIWIVRSAHRGTIKLSQPKLYILLSLVSRWHQALFSWPIVWHPPHFLCTLRLSDEVYREKHCPVHLWNFSATTLTDTLVQQMLVREEYRGCWLFKSFFFS